jgi:HrpA-like RNA helicase
VSERQVLVLDEVHEWNENMEVLIAWAKKRCQEDPHFKVVIMSATIDTKPLAQYFDTTAVITVPGRSYGVTKRRGRDVITEIIDTLPKGKNVLVFLPGKSEIQDVAEAIATKAAAAGVPIIPLHSQLELAEQQKAFENYPNGKVILSTNIAQTSVTIDDIDMVIDSGLERRSEVRSGVEGLFIAQISQADCLQRAGRAGRTKPGEYVLAQYDILPCLNFEEREEYGTPEILRKHIDRLTLRLANVGIDIEVLDFYHDPSKSAIKRAKQTLVALGAMTPGGQVTSIGREMERYPVESSYARMLVEGAVSSDEVRTKLAVIIAIQEVGGIVKGGARFTGWQSLTRQRRSDLLAQYDVYRLQSNRTKDDLEELGVISKNVTKATEVMERLNRDLVGISLDTSTLLPIEADEEEQLLRCIVAGQIDQLWSIDSDGNAVHIKLGATRELSSSTVVRNPTLITGTPFDLQVPARDGTLQTLHLVQGITAVQTSWLADIAPNVFITKPGKASYDPRSGQLVIRQYIRLGKKVIEGAGTPITQNTKQNQRLFQEGLAQWIADQLDRESSQLSRYHAKRIPRVPLQRIKMRVKSLAYDVISIDALPSARRELLFEMTYLETHLGAQFMHQVAASYKKGRSPGRHHAHRGWKPAHKRNRY